MLGQVRLCNVRLDNVRVLYGLLGEFTLGYFRSV